MSRIMDHLHLTWYISILTIKLFFSLWIYNQLWRKLELPLLLLLLLMMMKWVTKNKLKFMRARASESLRAISSLVSALFMIAQHEFLLSSSLACLCLCLCVLNRHFVVVSPELHLNSLLSWRTHKRTNKVEAPISHTHTQFQSPRAIASNFRATQFYYSAIHLARSLARSNFTNTKFVRSFLISQARARAYWSRERKFNCLSVFLFSISHTFDSHQRDPTNNKTWKRSRHHSSWNTRISTSSTTSTKLTKSRHVYVFVSFARSVCARECLLVQILSSRLEQVDLARARRSLTCPP